MHIRSGAITWNQTLQMILAGFLAVALVGFVAGCDSVGGDGDGDGDGDGTGISAPAAPSGLTGESGDGEIALGWDSVDDADSYNVYRSTSPTDGAAGDPLEGDVGESSYPDTEAENGTTYYYRVTAVNSGDDEEAESDASDEVAKTPFSEPPDQPE